MNMKGRVTAYSPSVNAGLIKGADGNDYQFHHKDWQNEDPPSLHQEVKFEKSPDSRAQTVVVLK
jgi:cold shock CspA family protein